MENVDLSYFDLRNINFKCANLRGCNLSNCDLSNCVLERADLSNANLDVSLECGGVTTMIQTTATSLVMQIHAPNRIALYH